jgi:hypothetical protein
MHPSPEVIKPAGAPSRYLQPLLSKHLSTNKIEMKPIEDADIERSWAEHFPKRLVNGHSKTVCAYICLILSHKAQHETAEDWSKKLRMVLRKFGVPENQFHRVKSKCNFR